MNRFDDAVLDLVSNAPPATTVDGLRARIRRRRRRRALAIVAVAGVISMSSVGIAASLGHKTSAPLIAVSPTTSTTVGGPRVSCPPMSRADAIQRAKKMPGGSPTSPVRAKLMTWAELHAHVPDAPSPLLTATTQVWVVEVRDWYFHDEPGPAADQPKPYPWALFIIDAHTGAPYGPVTGPGNSTPYWNLLPDHSKSCAPKASTPTPQLPVGLSLVNQPTWAPLRQTVTMKLHIDDPALAARPGANISILIHQSTTSRSAFDEMIAKHNLGQIIYVPNLIRVASLHPDRHGDVSIEFGLHGSGTRPIVIDHPGIYPVEVQLVNIGVLTAAFVTSLVSA